MQKGQKHACGSAGIPHENFVHRRLALMFTDIVGSTPHVVEVGDETWLSLLMWHNDVLRSSFAANGGREIAAMGDGFLVAFAEARFALGCARQIHEWLRADRHAAHRRMHVRIGMQWADVLETTDNCVGRGVHEAARISEIADGDEILATVALLAAAGEPFEAECVRSVELRGLPGSYELVSVPSAIGRHDSAFAGSLARM